MIDDHQIASIDYYEYPAQRSTFKFILRASVA